MRYRCNDVSQTRPRLELGDRAGRLGATCLGVRVGVMDLAVTTGFGYWGSLDLILHRGDKPVRFCALSIKLLPLMSSVVGASAVPVYGEDS